MHPVFWILIAIVVISNLGGCTTNVYNVTVDNSVIDQSDTTQVMGCATDSVYGELE